MINNGDGAENIGFVSKEVDLAAVMGQDEELVQLEHMNLTGMYILNRVCTSQSMSLVGAGFKNLKGLRSMLRRRFPALPNAEPPLGELPYITRQTLSYALSLVISCVCYAYNDTMIKGRPDQLYEKIIASYSELNDDDFMEILTDRLTDWVTKVTAPEPPGTMVLSQQRIASLDNARPTCARSAANTAAAAAAAAAPAPATQGSGEEGGGADATTPEDADGAGKEEDGGPEDNADYDNAAAAQESGPASPAANGKPEKKTVTPATRQQKGKRKG